MVPVGDTVHRMGLLGVVIGFFVYATVAHLTPEILRGKPQNLEALLVYLAFDPSALYGTPSATLHRSAYSPSL